MANKDFDLDDLDFDDFDIEIPEFNDTDSGSDDRKPIQKLSSGFKQGFRHAVTDPAAIKRTVGQALPRGYAQGLNAVDTVRETVSETFADIGKDLQPFVDGGRKAAARISEKMGKKLPKTIANAIDTFAAGGAQAGYNAARAKQESEDSLIADSIQQMFSKQAEQTAATFTEERAERTVRDAVEKNRYDQSEETQSIIARGVSRLVGYQDDVLIKFQQKQLELQYRHYFVAKDLFEATSLQNEKMVAAMDKLIKNTALPEAVKITQSEVMGQMLKERLSGAAFKNVANWTRDFRNKFSGNIKDYASGLTSGLSNGIEQGADLRDTMGAAQGGGFVAGNMLGGKIQDWGSNLIAPVLNKHQGLRRGGARIGNFLNNAPRAMNRWAKSETTGRGIGGFFSQMAKDLVPRFGLSDELSNNQVLMSDRPATFDNRSHKTLNEIIPGLLTQVVRWTKASATGKIDSEDDMTVWNMEKNRFTSRSEMLVDVKRRVMPVDGISSMRSELDELLKDLTNGSNISKEAMKALRKKILSDIARGEPFDPRDLTKAKFYKDVAPEYVDELRYFFRNRFRVTEDGYMEQTADEMDELGDLQSKFNSIGSMMPDPANIIRELQDVHGRDTFDRLGYTRRIGNQEMLNYDKIFEDMLNDSDVGRHDGTDYTAGGNAKRSRKARDVLNGDMERGRKKARSTDAGEIVGRIEASDLENYLGENSATVRELKEIKERVSNQKGSETDVAILQMLATLVDRMDANGQGGTGPGRAESAVKRFSKSMITAPFKMGWGITKGYFSGLRFGGKLGLGALSGIGGGVMDAARGAKNFMFKKGTEAKNAFDYHVVGRAYPALRGELLAAKEYFDVNSGKWIDDISQVTGEVKDRAGKVVLSAAEWRGGLITHTGKRIKTRFSSMMSGLGSLTSGSFQLSMLPAKALWATAKLTGQALFGRARDMASGATDYFLQGENRPRLLGIKLEQGAYFDSVTRKPLRKLGDIKGDICEYVNGKVRVVVKQEELMRSGGFYDYMGKKIAAGIGGLVGMGIAGAKMAAGAAWALGTMPFKAAGALLKGGADLLRGKKAVTVRPRAGFRAFFSSLFGKFRPSGDWKHDLIQLNQNQLEVLERMYGKVSNIESSSNGGMLDSALDMMEGRGRKRGRGRGRGRSRIPRGARVPGGVAGTAGRTAASTAARVGATAVAEGAVSQGAKAVGRQALWQGARMAGAALLGVVSAPVLVGAAVVATVAVGGYLVYRHYANKPTAIRGMRFAQYGIKPNDPDQVQAIAALEELLVKTATYSAEGEAKLDAGKLTVKQLSDIFKFDPESPDNQERIAKLGTWSRQRFQPVLLAHLTAAKRLVPGVDFKDLDEKIAAKVGVDYVGSTRLDDMTSVYNDVENSPFEDDLDSDASDVKSWIDKALDYFKERASKDPNAKKEDDKGFFASGLDKAKELGKSALGLVTLPHRKALELGKVAAGHLKDAGLGLWNAMPDTMKTVLGATPLGLLAKGWSKLKNIRSRLNEERDKFAGTTLDALTAGRYRVYGARTMHPDVVESLYKLENLLWDQVTYDGKQAVFNGDAGQVYPRIADIFGIKNSDAQHKADWFAWFSMRFLPAFLQYCSSVRVLQSIDAREALQRLTPGEQHKVLKDTAGATTNLDGEQISVWEVRQSPWKNHEVNPDPDSIKGNLDELVGAKNDVDYRERTKALSNVESQLSEAKRRRNIDSEDIGLTSSERAAKDREEKGFFSGIKDTLLGHKDKAGNRSGGFFTSDVDPQSVVDPNAPPLKGGVVMGDHPGGGTGGDINDVPSPTGSGWEASKATIITAAKMAGVDPYVAANVASIESRFNPNAQPRQRDGTLLSSAKGYFQFLDGTWKEKLKQYGPKYGISPNASPFDGRANALIGMEFLKENADGLKKHLGRDITDVDLYAAHFLGLGGAKRLLGANPGADARGHVGQKVPGSNPSVFFNKGGSAKTVSEVYAELTKRMTEANVHHKVKPGQTYAQLLGEEEASPPTDPNEVAGSTDVTPTGSTDVPLVDRNAAINGPAPQVNGSNVATPQQTSSAATQPTSEVSGAPEVPAAVSETAESAKAQVVSNNTQTTVVAEGLDGVTEGVGTLTGVNQSMDDKLANVVSLLQTIAQNSVTAPGGQQPQQKKTAVASSQPSKGSGQYLMRNTRNKSV